MAEGSATCTEEELLPLGGAKNTGVWQYFGFPASNGQFVEPDKRKRKSLRRMLCLQFLKYSSNTMNLRFHLHEHHQIEFGSLQIHNPGRGKERSTSVLTLQKAFSGSHIVPALA